MSIFSFLLLILFIKNCSEVGAREQDQQLFGLSEKEQEENRS
jgi:hypothetical protein